MDKLSDYIKVIDLLSESESDYILNCIDEEKYITAFYDAKVYNKKGKDSIIYHSSRNNLQTFIKPGSELDNLIYSKISEGYQKWLSLINLDQSQKVLFQNLNDTGYQINKYEVGQYYNYHVDNSVINNNENRVLSIVIYINDDYEGGELQFPFYTYKPSKGQGVFFPSDWLYPHRSCPVLKGTKYSIVTWLYE